MMEWYKYIFRKPSAPLAKQRIAELTEFEFSDSHKILLNTENMMKELLQYISDQQEIIKQQEEELKLLRLKRGADADDIKNN